MLLSWLGISIYGLMVRRHGTPWQRKGFLYLVLLGSLCLPWALGDLQDQPKLLPESMVTTAFGQHVHGEDMHLKHYCKCANPNLSHRIRYRTHHWYNVLLDYKPVLLAGVGMGMLWVLLTLAVQYRYLYRLKRSSRKSTYALDQNEIQLLYPDTPQGAGAFSLAGNAYIIWQPEMDELDQHELEAVLRHEWAHVQQYNTLERVLLRMIQCVWLLNPAIYFIQKELDVLSEHIADEAGSLALSSKKVYALLLLKLKKRQTAMLARGFHQGGKLEQRIKYLLHKPSRRTAWLPAIALLLVLGADWATAPTVSASVNKALSELATYEEIYKAHGESEEVIYCPDCETVCTPDDSTAVSIEE